MRYTRCTAQSVPEPTALNSRFRIRSPIPLQEHFLSGQLRLPFFFLEAIRMSLAPNLVERLLRARRFWLMKSEPGECSIDDALSTPNQTVSWFGIRNYQARNFIRDDMAVGDAVLFYHSSCAEPGIVGVAEIASAPYPDELQFDPESDYFDPKSPKDNPRWLTIDVKALAKCPVIPIKTLRNDPALVNLRILQRGNRLSITPVERDDFAHILKTLFH